ncbi:MAG TPA: PilZ domain-containing protein [Candidatus Binatia bacterium]|nr:PilZ domain-containing protein [Candidatus Binatia bacterium]
MKTPIPSKAPQPSARPQRGGAPAPEAATGRFLATLHLLARNRRMYQKDHPKVEESLFAAERSLQEAVGPASAVAVRLESGAMYFRGRALDDPRGELRAFADELLRRGISALTFRPGTHSGELIAFLELVDTVPPGAGNTPFAHGAVRSPWAERLAQRRISGIAVNEPVADARPDPMLPRILAAVLQQRSQVSTEAKPAQEAAAEDRIVAALKLLDGLARTLPSGSAASPDSAVIAAQEMERAFASADRSSVLLLSREMNRSPLQSGETHESYFARLAEEMALSESVEQFRSGRLRPAEVRKLATRVGRQIADLENAHPQVLAPLARLAGDSGAAEFESQFWGALEPEEISKLLRSDESWSVPPSILHGVLNCADTTPALREARSALLAYSKGLQSNEGEIRKAVVAGLADLGDMLLHYWPEQLPEEFGERVLEALVLERNPSIAALLVVVVERMADAALHKGRFAEFESVLKALETAPRGLEHLSLLERRLCEGERFELLLSGALAHRPLESGVVRILGRKPEPVVDALTSVLAGGGVEGEAAPLAALPAMVRLMKALGDPAIELLASRVHEKRLGRATAAVKLLAAVRPQRLVELLPEALPNWDWSVQDLAISEFARQRVSGLPEALLASLPRAHLYVVPMMLDLLSMEGDAAAVPVMFEIAAGQNERLKDVFIRIKAIEGLGRLRAAEAAPLLRAILRTRNGLSYAEPAGLRTAAEDALEAIEGRMTRSRLQEQLEAAANMAGAARPRRYPRFPLDSPLSARIEGKRPMTATVRTISLGGACLESNRGLQMGDAFPMEIKSGLRSISAMAVVRSILPNGTGVEFVHMGQEDREKLRKLLRGLQED